MSVRAAGLLLLLILETPPAAPVLASDPLAPDSEPPSNPDLGPLGWRFFEADEGLPINVLLVLETPSPFGHEHDQRLWDAAISAWNGHPSAHVELRRVGPITKLSGDPLPPGVLAAAGFFRSDFDFTCSYSRPVGGGIYGLDERKVFGGRTWFRATQSQAVIELNPGDTLDACPGYVSECYLARIATHEVGHLLGLGHLPPQATMDGDPDDPCRCANVIDLDVEELSAIYPAAVPPTILTPARLPHATNGELYAVQLEAVGGAGGFTWTTDLGDDQPSRPFSNGLTLSPEGRVSGTPVFDVSGAFQTVLVKATDRNGASHTKAFSLPIFSSVAPTTTTTTTTFAAPLVRPVIPCTVPTTTIPRWCGNVGPGCGRARCQAATLMNVAVETRHAPARLRRVVRRLSSLVSEAADAEEARRLRRARRRLARAARVSERLSRLLAEPAVVRRLGQTVAGRLGAETERLRGDYAACEAELSSPVSGGG